MAKARFLNAVNLKPVDRVPANEWIDHPEFVQKISGIDPFCDPAAAVAACIRVLDLDWYVALPKTSNRFIAGETKKTIGTSEFISQWGFTGSRWKTHHEYSSDEAVLSYNPFESSNQLKRLEVYRQTIDTIHADQAQVGEHCYISGLYYTTLFQWFILTFGWESFLMAAASQPKRFNIIIDRFATLSEEYTHYFAQTDLPVFYCHDDLALTRGLVFPPEWYRKYILPQYERIFAPLRQAGKKIIFVSDGNYAELIDDLIAVGVDGLMVDHFVDIDSILKRYGGKIMIAGNVDIAKITFGSISDVYLEVARCISYGKRYPGYVMKVTGDLPHNIPLKNIEAYFNACKELGSLSS